MRIEEDVKLDFDDVLIRPKRSNLSSRVDVVLERSFTTKYSNKILEGIPIIAANMDSIGTMPMAVALSNHGMFTALHKHYSNEDLISFFTNHAGLTKYVFYTMGTSNTDLMKFHEIKSLLIKKLGHNPIQNICVDVANGYTETFVKTIRSLRDQEAEITIMAGNVVTAEMTEELTLAGADIIKIGIGPGSVCTTRKITGIGYPQLSAVIECADAAHGLGGLICADGGIKVPGDFGKAFGAGADFTMCGGIFAGHDECGGEIINHDSYNPTMKFYGMSSDTAMEKYSGGVASYRASEGKTVEVPYQGPISKTVLEILGGLRSTCTYVGARKLKELSKRTTFIRVNRQLNNKFE